MSILKNAQDFVPAKEMTPRQRRTTKKGNGTTRMKYKENKQSENKSET